MKTPGERFESLLYICTKLSVEIDACFEMFEKEKLSLVGINARLDKQEKQISDLTEEMRKLRKALSPDE